MKKEQVKWLMNLLSILAVMATIAGFILIKTGKPEEGIVAFIFCGTVGLAALIVQLIYWISPNFGAKPTRDEFERRM